MTFSIGIDSNRNNNADFLMGYLVIYLHKKMCMKCRSIRAHQIRRLTRKEHKKIFLGSVDFLPKLRFFSEGHTFFLRKIAAITIGQSVDWSAYHRTFVIQHTLADSLGAILATRSNCVFGNTVTKNQQLELAENGTSPLSFSL